MGSPPEKQGIGNLSFRVGEMVKGGLVPDWVAITGVVANTGSRDDYDEAARWINDGWRKRLPRSFAEDRFLMVPGNHDVERAEVV